MNKKVYLNCCEELLKLKQILKCPICLEIITEHAELQCGHRFCKKCIYKHRSISVKPDVCPLCQKFLSRRSVVYKDKFGDALSNCIITICRMVEKRKALEDIVSEVQPDDVRIVNKESIVIESENEETSNPQLSTSKVVPTKTNICQRDIKHAKTSKILKSKREKMSKNNQVTVNEETKKNSLDKLSNSLHVDKKVTNIEKPLLIEPSTSNAAFVKLVTKPSTSKVISIRKSTRTRKKDVKNKKIDMHSKLKKGRAKKSDSKLVSVSKESKNNDFDNLLEPSQALYVNKDNTKHTYRGIKKILSFESIATKNSVITWLNDNRNKFDRLTQTQHYAEEHSENNVGTDLLSISQVHKGKSIGIENKPIRKFRSRSLHLEDKPKGNKERNCSLECAPKEDYTIEDINTEEIIKRAEQNVVMNILQDQCLNKMEEDEKLKRAKESRTEQKDNQITQCSSTGWQRAEKMTKTLRKRNKAPKKLNITLEHSQTVKQKKDAVFGVRRKGTAIHEKTDGIPATDKENTNDATECNREPSTSKADKRIPEDLNFPGFSHPCKENVEPNAKPLNESRQLSPRNSPQAKENAESVVNTIQYTPPPKKDETAVRNEPIEICDSKILILGNCLVKDADQVDPYQLPTQKLNASDQRCFEKTKNDSDHHPIDDEPDNFDDVMTKLLTTLQKYLDENKQLATQNVGSMQTHLKKLGELHRCYVVPPRTFEMAVQTDISVLEDAQTQTESVTHRSTEVQTEPSTSCERRQSGSGRSGSFSKTLKDDYFAGTLDLLNFETQEIEKQYLQKNAPPVADSSRLSEPDGASGRSPVPVMRSLKVLLTNEGSRIRGSPEKGVQNSQAANDKPEEGTLVCTLKSDVEENRAHLSLKRTFSDSDSSDVVALPKRRCNRFVRDDLSVEFGLTEQTKKTIFSTGLTPESEGLNDEEYLNKIIKKYVDRDGDSSPSSRKDDDVQENAVVPETDLEDIVARVNRNVGKLSKLNEPQKSTYETATKRSRHSIDDEMIFLDDEHNLKQLDDDLKKIIVDNPKENTENSDIIPESETIEPPPRKKPKPKTSDDPFTAELSLIANPQREEPGNKNGKEKETYCHELEDDLDVDFGNIEIHEGADGNSKRDSHKLNEEDLFSEEDDVVECTPQKEKVNVDRRSQPNTAVRCAVLDDIDREIFENFDADFTPLAPPPGFEDDENTDQEEVTVIDVNERQVEPTTPSKDRTSIPPTPENTPPRKNDEGYEALDVVVPKLSHSTPLTQRSFHKESIALSPIAQESSIFEKSYNSNSIVSNVNQDTPRKHNILTSNPKQKSILNYVMTPSQGSTTSSQPTATTSSSKRKPCIACTRLSKDQIQSVSLLTNKKLATYSSKFNDAVTHMIVTVDKTGRIRDYTMKFVSAVAAGIWVVGFEWIQECLKTNAIVSEEPYEVLDDSGNTGPKTSRLTRMKNPLFKDYKFFCVSPLYSTSVQDVEDVILRLGGIMVRNLDNLKEKDARIGLIITEGRSTQDFEIYEKWLEKYKIATVDIEWLSRSVGRYKLLSIRPYIWCSDDILDNLGYPPSLVESVNTSSEIC